jgi:hypothetical protein
LQQPRLPDGNCAHVLGAAVRNAHADSQPDEGDGASPGTGEEQPCPQCGTFVSNGVCLNRECTFAEDGLKTWLAAMKRKRGVVIPYGFGVSPQEKDMMEHPHAERYAHLWKGFTPGLQEIRDPWTGNMYTVSLTQPLAMYPKGYFGDSPSARLPFYSPQEKVAHYLFLIEQRISILPSLRSEYDRKKVFDMLEEWKRLAEQAYAEIRGALA